MKSRWSMLARFVGIGTVSFAYPMTWPRGSWESISLCSSAVSSQKSKSLCSIQRCIRFNASMKCQFWWDLNQSHNIIIHFKNMNSKFYLLNPNWRYFIQCYLHLGYITIHHRCGATKFCLFVRRNALVL